MSLQSFGIYLLFSYCAQCYYAQNYASIVYKGLPLMKGHSLYKGHIVMYQCTFKFTPEVRTPLYYLRPNFFPQWWPQ